MTTLWLTGGLVLSACDGAQIQEAGETTAMEVPELVIYSPAPPGIMLDRQNQALGEVLEACGVAAKVTVIPVALPDSINQINALEPAEKPFHLPIVTTLDFQTAVDETAPDWHGYDRANTDLKFVGSLYEVSFGIMVFDPEITTPQDLAGKRIAVPARPSAVRWFSEVLLQDGWLILDEVELVELAPPQVMAAVASREVDAVAWNIMSQTPDGFEPLLPPLMDVEGARWLDVDASTLDRINAANPFDTARVTVPTSEGDSAQLLSFRQGLAAWETTPDTLVGDIVNCLSAAELPFGSADGFAADQFNWPGLGEGQVHPAAKD